MRRTAAVALTVVTLGAGVGLTAVPAGAAPKKVTKSWSTFQGKNKLKAVHAAGKYTRKGKKIVIKGRISDRKKDGYTPAIQFRAYNNGKWTVTTPVGIFTTPGRKPIDGVATVPAKNKAMAKIDTLRGNRLQVREVAIRTSNNKPVFGAWKKLF